MALWRRCDHRWVDEVWNFQPGAEGRLESAEVRGERFQETFRLMLFGQTTVVQRCSGCGMTRSWTVSGDARPSTADKAGASAARP